MTQKAQDDANQSTVANLTSNYNNSNLTIMLHGTPTESDDGKIKMLQRLNPHQHLQHHIHQSWSR